ncbi:hypothetical protein FB451DRAFT_1326516 [Mycena latifolia]|nr:hypothetical protein FB451DRAFT_1326516 [Mycena latifolia]
MEPDDDFDNNNDDFRVPPENFGCSVRADGHPWNAMSNWHNLDNTEHGSAVSDKIEYSIRRQLYKVDSNGCFMLNRFHVLDQAAHIADSLRHSPGQKDEATSTLIQLGIVPLDFHLEHPSNLRWISAVWHIGLDKYGLWTWAPFLGTVKYLLGVLQAERLDRQAYYDEHKRAPWRKWDAGWLETLSIRFEPMILYPEVVFTTGEPMLRWHEGRFHVFYPGVDGYLHRESPDGPRLSAFQSAGLNPFLVALSCHNKLSHYFDKRRQANLDENTSPYYEFYKELDALVEEIYRPLEAIPDISDRTITVNPLSCSLRSWQRPPIVESWVQQGGPLGSGGSQVGSSQGSDSGADVLALANVCQSTSLEEVALNNAACNLSSDMSALSITTDSTDKSSVDEANDFASNTASTGLPSTLSERIAYGRALFFKPIEDWREADAREDDGVAEDPQGTQ